MVGRMAGSGRRTVALLLASLLALALAPTAGPAASAAGQPVGSPAGRDAAGPRPAPARQAVLPPRSVGSDFDGDGLLDLLARRDSTGELFMYRRTSMSWQDTGWRRALRVGNGWGGYSELVGPGDFTGDGIPDLLARETATGVMWVYPGNGRAGWRQRLRVGAGWSPFEELTGVGDFDEDGHADVIARHGPTATLWLFRGNGRGGFAGYAQIGRGWGGYELIAVGDIARDSDFPGDGHDDLGACGANGRALVFPGDGRGGWRGAGIYFMVDGCYLYHLEGVGLLGFDGVAPAGAIGTTTDGLLVENFLSYHIEYAGPLSQVIGSGWQGYSELTT